MPGYNEFANLIGSYPDLTIYRKFATLASKNLLYMQAELVYLENELKTISEMDHENPEKRGFGVSWKALNEASGGGAVQKRIVLEIRQKLKEYHEALLLVSQIHGLRKPLDADLAFLREWLERPDGGDFFLKNMEAQPWNQSDPADLVVLFSSSFNNDHFARYMSDKMVPWYHRRFGHKSKKPSPKSESGGVWEYKGEWFVILGNVICMLLSSLVPSATILGLYFVRSMGARLAVITAMSFIFSVVMTVIVQGRRVDVFAATTAFAAVQVVFVSGQNIFLQHD